MQDYTHVYENADKILAYFIKNPDNRQQFNETELTKIIADKVILNQAISALISDGYLTFSNLGDSYDFTITGPGTILAKNGGYNEEFERRKFVNETKYKVDQSIIKTNLSVEKTNTSIQTLYDKTLPENFTTQDRASKWSLILAGISVAFIAITAYQQCRDKTDQRIEELKQEVKETSKTLKEIQPSLKEINSSIQKVTTDTLLVKKKRE